MVATTSNHINEELDIAELSNKKGSEIWVVQVPSTIKNTDLDGMKLQVGSSGVAGSHKVERLGKSVSLRKAATGTLDGLHCVYGSTADNQVVVRSIPAARVMKIVVDRLDCSTLEKPDVDLADVEPFVLPQREGMRIRFAPTGATPGARISVADTDPAATKSRKRPSSAIGAKKSKKAKKKKAKKEKKAKSSKA